jgi:hypothetical protein
MYVILVMFPVKSQILGEAGGGVEVTPNQRIYKNLRKKNNMLAS